MAFQPKNILLIGATGQIGSHILSALLTARQEFNRIALFTSASTASKKATYLSDLRTNHQVEVIVGDITNEKDIRNAYNGNPPSSLSIYSSPPKAKQIKNQGSTP